MLFRAEMAKAAPYVHAQLASTEIKTIGHITPATGTPQRPDAAADGGGACTGHITGRQPPFMRAGNYAFDMWMT
jgi:hypothetical protein